MTMARLQQLYRDKISPELMEKFGYKSPMQVPRPDLPEGENPYAALEISRNAPCPCGSGRKYKHCHGQL